MLDEITRVLAPGWKLERIDFSEEVFNVMVDVHHNEDGSHQVAAF
ncbi:MAG: hypothetical protein ACUVRL_03060 [Candidatus Saccharicenans sp.]